MNFLNFIRNIFKFQLSPERIFVNQIENIKDLTKAK